MNNYPPGVTGNEPEIVGPSTIEELIKCVFCSSIEMDCDDRDYTIWLDGAEIYLTFWHCRRCGMQFYIGA